MKAVIVFCMMFVFIGCATVPSSQIMVNPVTGKAVNVSHHSWGWGAAGIAAAIGAQQAQKSDIDALKKAGFVEIEKVGTVGIDYPDEDLKPVVVTKVYPNGPADKAGIKSGDQITEKNGTPIKTVGDIRSQPRANPGEIVDLKILRDGKTSAVTLVAVLMSDMLGQK